MKSIISTPCHLHKSPCEVARAILFGHLASDYGRITHVSNHVPSRVDEKTEILRGFPLPSRRSRFPISPLQQVPTIYAAAGQFLASIQHRYRSMYSPVIRLSKGLSVFRL